jgi:hypothetical protein
MRVPSAADSPATDAGSGDPLAALRAATAMADPTGTSLLLLHNFHRFLGSPEVVQTTFTQLVAGKERRTFFVVLSPVVQIPVELEKLFVVIEHALPDRRIRRRIHILAGRDSVEGLNLFSPSRRSGDVEIFRWRTGIVLA